MRNRNITCKVVVDGEDAEEYGEEADKEDDSCKTSYIVAQDDKPFSLVIDLCDKEHHGTRFCYHLFVDGERLRNMNYRSSSSSSPLICSDSFLKTSTGMWERRPFTFAKLETVDADSTEIEQRADVLEQIGTLKVIIWTCKAIKKDPAPPPRTPQSSHTVLKPIHERDLKGLSVTHRAVLGEPSYVSSGTRYTKLVKPSLATFIFKYSSLESLQAQGMVPRPPAEESESNESDEAQKQPRQDVSRRSLDEMSMTEMRDELRRRREAEDAAAADEERHRKIKQEVKQENALRVREGVDLPKFYDLTGDEALG